ncbi:MAG: GAF domain-containing sensor histidine kinase [Nitrospinota bacterium]|nr:GAF domain-containing sensor histidine kinase [Nitrospinota bacterium]
MIEEKKENIQILRERLKTALRERKIYSEALSESNRRFNTMIKEMSILRRVTESISASINKRSVCESLVEIIISETAAENCSLMLLSNDRQHLILTAAMSQSDSKPAYFSPEDSPRIMRVGEGIAGNVALSNSEQFVVDTGNSELFMHFPDGREDINSLYCLPISGKQGLLGVLNLSHPYTGSLLWENKKVLEIVTRETALALSNIQIFYDIREFTGKLEQAGEDAALAAKMTALSDLAGGLAHEINNPIAIIHGNAEDMLERIESDDVPDADTTKETLQTIIDSAKRCSSIIESILEFAKPVPHSFKECSVDEIVSSSLNKYQSSGNGEKVEISVNGNGLGSNITTSPVHLSRVLINLLDNAIEASKHGSKREKVELAVEKRDQTIIFSITDYGRGIPKENFSKIFNPFFTTKEPGKGPGMGLTISYLLTRKLGGNIFANSDTGKTTFTVSLPL